MLVKKGIKNLDASETSFTDCALVALLRSSEHELTCVLTDIFNLKDIFQIAEKSQL